MIDRRSLLALIATTPFLAPRLAMANPAPSIVATTGMIADIARRLTGGPAQALMGPGMDPHGYRPTRSDILALSRADIVLWHGLHLESQFIDVMADLAQKKPVVAVADVIAKDRLLGDPAYADRPDPHVWFDPTLWSDVVKVLPPHSPLQGWTWPRPPPPIRMRLPPCTLIPSAA